MSSSILGRLPYPEKVCLACAGVLAKEPERRNFVLKPATCDVCLSTEVPCASPDNWGGLNWPPPTRMKPEITSLEEMIPYVIGEFDFQKVRDCMKLLNWEWIGDMAVPGVPGVDKLKGKARLLLREAILGYRKTKEHYSVSTGGLRASAGEESLELEFVLEHSYSELDDFE